MATERQSPDTILIMTELTGVVSDIQDDPDNPDGNWLAATGNNTNTDVRTSFPTPTGNPTVGTDLQEFRILVRQYDEGQSGTPDARIELWENGILIRAGSDTAVPQGGIVLSFTWNANELATPDGSLVECKVVGTKTGGSPAKRNTVEVGAVEWNVAYESVPPEVAAGRIAVEQYWTDHEALYNGGWYPGISEDHTPLLNTLLAALAAQGFNTLAEFWVASNAVGDGWPQ